MRKTIIALLFTMFIFALAEPVLAHPGRTDRRGCHTCYTNCARWGLRYNQYHCHRSK